MMQTKECDPEKINQLIAEKLKQFFPSGCRRILFVNPPQVLEENYDPAIAENNRYSIYPPYGEGILCADLTSRGYQTDIIDLNYLIQESLKTEPRVFRFGNWKRWLEKKLAEFKPDLVGITCMFSISHRQVLRTADFIKTCNSDVIIFAGGSDVTATSEFTLRECRNIDFVSLFAGNQSFGDIIDYINGRGDSDQITQIATLIDNQYLAITKRAPTTQRSLNLAPLYHDLPIGNYSALGRIGGFHWLLPPDIRAGTVLANRGCRGNCAFCSTRFFYGPLVVQRDITAIVDEMEFLRDKYEIRHIMWLDDDLFNGPERTVDLFNEMVKRNLGCTWDATNGVIASALTEEIAQAAAESGCIALSFGIESGNKEILRIIRKPSGIQHYHRAAEIIKKYPKIWTKGLLIIGFPPNSSIGFRGETIGQIWDTIKLAKFMGLDWYTIQILNYVPGSEITRRAVNEGSINEKELVDGTESPFTGVLGSQIQRESKEKEQALTFANLLKGDHDRVPLRSEFKDIWLVVDWEINYRKIPALSDKIKVDMFHKLFVNMCDQTHKDHALGNLYFAEIEMKLNNREAAEQRLHLAQRLCESSDYWQKRFQVLGLDRLMQEMREKIEH